MSQKLGKLEKFLRIGGSLGYKKFHIQFVDNLYFTLAPRGFFGSGIEVLKGRAFQGGSASRGSGRRTPRTREFSNFFKESKKNLQF